MIQSIAAGVLTAFFILKLSGWMKPTSWLYFKPFNCLPCLSGWLSLLFYFMPVIGLKIALVTFGGASAAVMYSEVFEFTWKKLRS